MTQRVSIPNDTPVGVPLSAKQRSLLESNQSLLMVAHRAIVDDLNARSQAQFSPFGICVRADGSHLTVGIASRTVLPEGQKVFLNNAMAPLSMENLGFQQALVHLMGWFCNESAAENMVTALICFQDVEASRPGSDYAIGMLLESNQGASVRCMGTYRPLALENTWEFSDLSGIGINPFIFS